MRTLQRTLTKVFLKVLLQKVFLKWDNFAKLSTVMKILIPNGVVFIFIQQLKNLKTVYTNVKYRLSKKVTCL